MSLFGKVVTWQTLTIALAALITVGMSSAPAQQIAMPITVTGWNQDVILDINPATRYAVSVDAGDCSLYENTAVADADMTEYDDGIIAGSIYNSMTGLANYSIQPAAGNNALQVYRGVAGTLTLATPAPYSQLYVIAHSGNASGTELGSGVVNYADGSTLAFTYNTFDWCGNHPEAAIAGLGRGCSNTDAGNYFQYNNCGGVQLYETAIATDNTKNVASVTFYGHVGANFGGLSNVYAISGQ